MDFRKHKSATTNTNRTNTNRTNTISTMRRPELSTSSTSSSNRAMAIPEPPQDLTKCISMSAADTADDDAVIAAPPEEAATTTMMMMNDENMTRMISAAPAEIPPEENTSTTKPSGGNNDVSGGEDNDGDEANNINDDDDDDDWGDEDSYEYEDDDDVAFSGFLAPTAAPHPPSTRNSRSAAAAAPARIVEEEGGSEKAADDEDDAAGTSAKRKWKEPTRAAVNMSLRAQSESTGGKRRLAQDLYRIMNQDTEEAGFSLQPKSEDSMDNWVIKLFQFDDDSNLAKDMKVLGVGHIELEMKFPDQYPFEPPFVRVVRPRFKKQTGFVMNGALCMELLTKDGWNPINDIESVIVSVRSLLVVGDGRLHAASELSESRYEALLEAANDNTNLASVDVAEETPKAGGDEWEKNDPSDESSSSEPAAKRARVEGSVSDEKPKPVSKEQVGSYTASEAQSAYSHLSDYHKKKGWDTSGWWSRKG